MGRKPKVTLTVVLSETEAVTLCNHLSGLVGKGSLNTTPAWARKLVHKIYRAAKDQWEKTNA